MPLENIGGDQPYFCNFSAKNTGPELKKGNWGPVFSQWNHFSAITTCPNGDILAVWYTTVNESGRECSQAVSRLRAGSQRWDPVCSFLTVPDVNCHAPVLMRDGKRLLHFFTQSLRGWDNATNALRISDDNGVTWSHPRIILDRASPQALSQPCCCIKTSDGNLLLACDGDRHKDERFMIGSKNATEWRVARGDLRAQAGAYVIHPTVFQKRDGTLATYLRGQNPMPVAYSKDGGDSFTVERSIFPGLSSGMKAAVLRLQSGAVLLCTIDTEKKLVGGGTLAALSLDDGQTWPFRRALEGTGGYMSVCQSDNGLIYVNGTRFGIVAFNEAWLKEKKK